MAVRHILRLIWYHCTLSSIFTLKIGKHNWEIWHFNRKHKKTVCVLQCGKTECQDAIPDDWACAIFVSAKMSLVLWIWNYMTTWNSTQTFRDSRKHGRGGHREKNVEMKGLVARYHVRDCLWGEARWWGSKVEQCGGMCTRLRGWQKNNEHSRELQKNKPPPYQERLNLLKNSIKINAITEVVTLTVVLINSLLICTVELRCT